MIFESFWAAKHLFQIEYHYKPILFKRYDVRHKIVEIFTNVW